MTTKVSFSLVALGACNYDKWVKTMDAIVEIINSNEGLKDHFATPLVIIGEIDNVYPATTNFSYRTNDSKQETKKTCYGMSSSLISVGLMTDLEIN